MTPLITVAKCISAAKTNATILELEW